ncbi:MAG: tyrosine-type recombinase/integrase [Methanobrevibacter sp.]|nr:tyrosine-type recombinase/integrase [Methanobrevibacter sp.]
MRTTFNIGFVCRQSKVTKAGKAPVEMSIIINGKRTYLTLPMKEDPKSFQKLVASKKMNPMKEYLEQIYQKVVVAQTELVKNDIPVTAISLKDYIQNGCTTSYTIDDLFTEYLKILKKRVGVNLTAAVYRKYEIVRDLFYGSISNTKQVNEITNGVIANFYAELNRKYESTTSAAMMVKLKTIITYALDNGKLKINPFNSIKISKRTKEVEYLTLDEIQAIKSKSFNGRLEKVRDLFLFQCFTGLAYADMAQLTKEDFQFNGEQIFIKKCRVKTGISYLTVLIDEAVEIVKRYNFELPVLSNQKYNSYLKEIADLCGITKPMHTHIGRHTFATYMLNKGVSIEVVAKMLGHSNIKQTQHYSKLVDKTVFKAVEKL